MITKKQRTRQQNLIYAPLKQRIFFINFSCENLRRHNINFSAAVKWLICISFIFAMGNAKFFLIPNAFEKQEIRDSLAICPQCAAKIILFCEPNFQSWFLKIITRLEATWIQKSGFKRIIRVCLCLFVF